MSHNFLDKSTWKMFVIVHKMKDSKSNIKVSCMERKTLEPEQTSTCDNRCMDVWWDGDLCFSI